MNIYNITKSSYSLFDQGLSLQGEANYGNLKYSGTTQEKRQLLQVKGSKAGAPYELWMVAQKMWKPLLQSAESNSEKTNVEKAEPASENAKNISKEDREDAVNSLLAERTLCIYPFETEEGEPFTLTYFTFYEKDRIYCVKEGSDGYEWEMPLEDETQYEKVMSFLDSLKDKENLRFASHENFWQDYLSGELDMEGFQNFLDTKVHKGIPDYTYVTEEGVYFDKEAVRFSKYVDQSFCNVIATTEKEFLDWMMAKVAKRELTLQETDPVEYHYRMFGDRGQRIHNFHGKLYTYEEYFPLEMQEAREAMAKAGNLIDDFYVRNGWTVERFWEVTSSVGKS